MGPYWVLKPFIPRVLPHTWGCHHNLPVSSWTARRKSWNTESTFIAQKGKKAADNKLFSYFYMFNRCLANWAKSATWKKTFSCHRWWFQHMFSAEPITSIKPQTCCSLACAWSLLGFASQSVSMLYLFVCTGINLLSWPSTWRWVFSPHQLWRQW